METNRMSPLYEHILLNVSVISDTHIDVLHPHPEYPANRLKEAFFDAKTHTVPTDALVIVGDSTSESSDDNWDLFETVLDETGMPAEKLLLAIGNHDTWDDEDNDGIPRYLRRSAHLTGISHDRPYFTEYVNGYPMIFLGSEKDAGCGAYISDAQLAWFDAEMAKAAALGKPIFVFCHQSMNQKHGLPVTWDEEEKPDANPWEGGIGEASDRVEAIMKQYKNVFYFSGHSHMGFAGEKTKAQRGFASIEREDGLVLVNLPSLACGNHHGEWNEFGIGVQMEAYVDRVVLRVRCHMTRQWNETVPVENGKLYFEQIL